MKLFRVFLLILIGTAPLVTTAMGRADEGSIVQDYPNLKKYIYEEPDSHVRIGFGLSPFGIMRSQLSVGASLFQFHWIIRGWIGKCSA